jgi:hypothetical protein
MPRGRFEPTIPASKRAKTVHALDHSATVTGIKLFNIIKFVINDMVQDFNAFIAFLNDPHTFKSRHSVVV